MRFAKPGSILVLLALACAPLAALDTEHYREDVLAWRQARDERLRSDTGWLTLVGLDWLTPGENRAGSDPELEVVLPEGTAPARVGSFFLEDARVRFRALPGAGVTIDGEPLTERELAPDTSGEPDVLKLGDLTFYVIERDGRYAVRVKNSRSPLLLGFRGIDYFPIDPAFRFEADFVPYDEAREVTVSTVNGTRATMMALGRAEFEIGGRRVALEPYVSSPQDDQFWFIFRDGTSGRETYGAGRYLYTEREHDGKVVVDFNYAYNPPCVFTPYATCPLPPRSNWMKARIEAGEKIYGAGH